MSIELMSKYIPLLDEKYAAEAKTALLDADPQMVRETAEAATVMIPQMTLNGLGDYSRTDGYPEGNLSVSWQALTFSKDRGRIFSVDSADNLETAAVAFGHLAGEFIAAKVAPELDASRFAAYAEGADPSHVVAKTVTAASVVADIDEGIAALDAADVPDHDRILFVSPAVYAALSQTDSFVRTYDGNGVDRRIDHYDGMQVVKVPASRFYTGITLADGVSEGQQEGGYVPAEDAVGINFMILQKSAVLQITKMAKIKVILPEQNPAADAYRFGYRLYHDAFVKEQKNKGIYVCTLQA